MNFEKLKIKSLSIWNSIKVNYKKFSFSAVFNYIKNKKYNSSLLYISITHSMLAYFIWDVGKFLNRQFWNLVEYPYGFIKIFIVSYEGIKKEKDFGMKSMVVLYAVYDWIFSYKKLCAIAPYAFAVVMIAIGTEGQYHLDWVTLYWWVGPEYKSGLYLYRLARKINRFYNGYYTGKVWDDDYADY